MNIETNKIAGAVFGSLLFVVGVNVIAGGLFAPHKPAVPGYDLPAPEEAAEPTPTVAPTVEPAASPAA